MNWGTLFNLVTLSRRDCRDLAAARVPAAQLGEKKCPYAEKSMEATDGCNAKSLCDCSHRLFALRDPRSGPHALKLGEGRNEGAPPASTSGAHLVGRYDFQVREILPIVENPIGEAL